MKKHVTVDVGLVETEIKITLTTSSASDLAGALEDITSSICVDLNDVQIDPTGPGAHLLDHMASMGWIKTKQETA